MFGFGSWRETPKRRHRRGDLALGLTLLLPALAWGQSRVWTTETVDTYGTGTSLAADNDGNVHISYGGAQGLTYGFRPADQPKWFTMPVGGSTNQTNLALDQWGNPHVCVTYGLLPLRYAHFDGKKWTADEIGTDKTGIEYSCAVAIGPDGTPHLTWYKLGEAWYAHVRYAILRDGEWISRTLDFDAQTGKWHSMILDSQGNPYISYDAFVKGLLKCAHWDGKSWKIQVVDSRGSHGSDYSIGMGSHVAFDSAGLLNISYYTENYLRLARQENGTWRIETVDTVSPDNGNREYRTNLVFDKKGFPHISYEDLGTLKLAHWDGKRWEIQVIERSGAVPFRDSSMAIDKNRDIIYVCYRDSADGTLQVAIGRSVEKAPAAFASKKQ